LFESSLVYSRRTKKTCTNPNSFTAIFQQEQILSVSYDFYTHARKSSFSDHRISIEERDQFDEDDEEEKRPYPDLQKGLGDQKDILEDFEFFDQPETCYNIEYFEQNLKANLMMNYNEDFSSQSSKSVRSNEGTLSLNSHSNKFSVESDESLKGFSPSFDRDCFESEFFGMGRNRRDKRNKGK
jgi:hypothetical protein